MNGGTKLSSKKSYPLASEIPHRKIQTKKKSNPSNPRNPLKELNTTISSSSSSTSIEAPRGCFRFLLSSNASSKTTLPRSKSLPQTPQCASTATPKATPTASNSRLKPHQRNPTRPRSQIPQKPRSSYLLRWPSGKKSSSKGQYSSENDTGKRAQPSFNKVLNENCTPGRKSASGSCLVSTNGDEVLERISTVPFPDLRFGEFFEINGNSVSKLASGCRFISSPNKALEEHAATLPMLAHVSPKIDSSKPSETSCRAIVQISGTPVNKLPPGSCLLSTPNKVLQGQSSAKRASDVNFRAPLEVKGTPANKVASGSCLEFAPDEASEEKSTTTPPVQASMSPEIQCGLSLVATPACFAAGHVVVGVSDRRKCKPRGLLTVGEEVEVLEFCDSRASLIPAPAEASMHWHLSPAEGEKKFVQNISPESERSAATGLVGDADSVVGFSDSSSGVRLSMVTSPNVKSVNWMLSPCENQKKVPIQNGSPESDGLVGAMTVAEELILGSSDSCSSIRVSMVHSPAEASLNWVLSHSKGTEKGVVRNGSLEFEGLMGTGASVSEIKPSGHEFNGPSATNAASSCSWIVGGQATFFGSKSPMPQEERGYRYNQALENSPFSSNSWGSHNVICTPVSDSSPGTQLGFSWLNLKDVSDSRFELSSMAEALQTVRLSPQGCVETCERTDVSPLHGLNFQLSCPATPSNSINASQMLKPSYDKKFGMQEFHCWEERSSNPSFDTSSQMRISWREGLVSRIFEMDEWDCSWSLPEEEEGDYYGNDRLESNFGLEFGQNVRNSTSTNHNELQSTNGFRSTEFLYDAGDDMETEGKLPPPGSISCAESISTEGGGLTASDDSGWTVFYKNQLFEMGVEMPV